VTSFFSITIVPIKNEKMILLKIYLFCAVVSGFNCNDREYQTMVFTGTALDAKAGAVVVTDDKGIYYVDGLAGWDRKFYGKKVKITGKLSEENNKGDTTKVQVQEIVGTKKIIRNAKWEIAK